MKEKQLRIILNLRHRDGSGRLLEVSTRWWWRFVNRLEKAERAALRAK